MDAPRGCFANVLPTFCSSCTNKLSTYCQHFENSNNFSFNLCLICHRMPWWILHEDAWTPPAGTEGIASPGGERSIRYDCWILKMQTLMFPFLLFCREKNYSFIQGVLHLCSRMGGCKVEIRRRNKLTHICSNLTWFILIIWWKKKYDWQQVAHLKTNLTPGVRSTPMIVWATPARTEDSAETRPTDTLATVLEVICNQHLANCIVRR